MTEPRRNGNLKAMTPKSTSGQMKAVSADIIAAFKEMKAMGADMSELESGGSATRFGIVAATEFTADGTWTKNADTVFVDVEVIGGGAGGEAGRSADRAEERCEGGGGGSAGSVLVGRFRAMDLPSMATIIVGLGGRAGDPSDTDGGFGGESWFGDILRAMGGRPNGAIPRDGLIANPDGGIGVLRVGELSNVVPGRGGDKNGPTPGGKGSPPAFLGGPGGGGCGGTLIDADNANDPTQGGAGFGIENHKGIFQTFHDDSTDMYGEGGGAPGVVPGGHAVNPPNAAFSDFGDGGSGGAQATNGSMNGGNGANGAAPGGGGGGGGAAQAPALAGYAGAGARGAVRVTEYGNVAA